MDKMLSVIFSMSLSASVVIIAVLAARLFLNRMPKIFSYALWAVVLFRLLCPAGIPVSVTLSETQQLPTRPIEIIEVGSERVPEHVHRVPEPDTQIHQNIPVAESATGKDAPMHKIRMFSKEEVPAAVWLAGAAILGTYGIWSDIRFRRKLRLSCQVKENLYMADHIQSAYVVGFWRPKIYIPSDLGEKEAEYVIAHEQCHIKRLDHITRHLAFLALCLHWFNPLVWIAFILSGRDMEMSCDEQVIRKTGLHIRADYAATLVTLARGHAHLSGSPLAFGEGNTKNRVLNIANWKTPTKRASALGMAGCMVVTLLCACQPTPETNTVISKNDGAFESIISQENTLPDGAEEDSIVKTDQFTSTDGSVTFKWNLNQEIDKRPMPVLEAKPHYLTGEDVHKIAVAVFGENAVFYDVKGEIIERQLSKQQLKEKIQLLSKYADKTKLDELMGEEANLDYVKVRLQDYIEQYENAPEEVLLTECDWDLKEDYYYIENEWRDDEWLKGEKRIIATTKVDGQDYVLCTRVRDQGEVLRNKVSIYLGDGNDPTYVQYHYAVAEKCMTEKPTQKQIASITEKAQNILDKMGMGEFVIANTEIDTFYVCDKPCYRIRIDAVPVFEDRPVLHGDRVRSCTGDNSYKFDYPVGWMSMTFSANEELITCSVDYPVEITEVRNKNVRTIPVNDLIEKAQNHMSLYDADAMDHLFSIAFMYETFTGKDASKLECKVEITEMEYGLARFPIPDSNDFYYGPAVSFSGTIDYYDPNTGEIVAGSGDRISRIQPLVVLNTVDGTIK